MIVSLVFALMLQDVARAGFTITSSYGLAVLARNPVAYWPLTETNGTMAFDFAGTNNGTYVGGYQLGQPGLPAVTGFGTNTSVSFDGTSGYVDIPAGGLNFTGPMTVIAWVKPSATGEPNFATALGHGDPSYRLTVVDSGPSPQGQPRFADPGGDVYNPNLSIADGTWHQLAGVYDGTNQYLYVDGQLQGTPGGGIPAGSAYDLLIGAAPDYLGTRNFQGNIAQVAIFTNALSATNIAAIYNSADPAPSIALVDTPAEAGLSISVSASGQYSVTITNFTVSPMANVLVALVEDKGASAVHSEPATLAWGSQTLTRAVVQDNPSATLRGEAIYYLYNPAPGTNNISVAVANKPVAIELTAYTLRGVNTTVAPITGSGGNATVEVTFNLAGVAAGSWAAVNSTWAAQSPVPTITGTGGTTTMTPFLMVDSQSTIITAGYISGLWGGTDAFKASWNAGGQNNNFAVAVFTPQTTAINIAAAAATPNPVPQGTPVQLSVTATSTAGAIASVVVNASAIGGPSAVTLSLFGGNVYTNTVTATIASTGAILPVTVRDSAGNTLAGSLPVHVETLADMAFDSYNNAYLIQTQNGLGLDYYESSLTNRNTESGWGYAIDIEGAIDAYERTLSPVRQQLVHSLCIDLLLVTPTNGWAGDGWNDDIGWESLVMIRGYQKTGDTNFLLAAEYGFNMAFARGWDTNFNNGGIWELQPASDSGEPGKNPLACDSLLQTVCMIYQSTGNANYLNRALQIYGWVRTNLFEAGLICGSISTNGVVNTGPNLYNQGTFLDCANLMHDITGQQSYYTDALQDVEFTRNNVTDNSIFSTGTGPLTWAAEFARGLGHFVSDNNLWSTYYPWMLANAEAAWGCRRLDYKVSWNEWVAPTPTNMDVKVGWDVDVVAMTSATPATEPGLVNCTNQSHGKVIGTSGSWNNSGNTIANVFDGNLNTFFDGPDDSGDWVGLDFGVGVSNVIGQINYWPRSGWSERMLGGVFQGDSSPTFPHPVTLFTIATAPPENYVVTSQAITNTNAFRCVRYVGPANAACDVAEIQFFAPNPTFGITGEPVWTPATNYVGTSASATVVAPGATSYQWRAGLNGNDTNLVDGGNISGSATATLTINSVQLSNALDYVVVVANANGAVTSAPPATLYVLPPRLATNFTFNFGGAPVVEASGADWNTPDNWNPYGQPANVLEFSNPGSTYEVVVGARLRTPLLTNSTFPGVELVIDGDGVFENNTLNHVGELWLQTTQPGTNHFSKLVMAGGQIDNGGAATDSTPEVLAVMQGEIDINANTPVYVDTTAGHNRSIQIDAWLTGTGNLLWHNFTGVINGCNLRITCATNTFNGQWIVDQGALLGVNAGSLGTNNLIVGTNGLAAQVETLYDLNNPNASLILGPNGRLFLHQNDRFNRVIVNGTALVGGVYSFAALNASYPLNFPASWPQLTNSSFSNGSGQIIVGPPPAPQITGIALNGATLSVSATNGAASGSWILLQSTNVALPLSQWLTNATGNFDGNGNMSANLPNTATNSQEFYILEAQ